MEKSDKMNFKEKKEKKGYITWEDNVINYSSDSEKKIISLNIMMKDYENGEEQSRYIDSNFSKHMACIKVYSYFSPRKVNMRFMETTNKGHLINNPNK